MKRMALAAAVSVCLCYDASASSDGAWWQGERNLHRQVVAEDTGSVPPAAFDDATGRSPCCLGDSPAGSKVKLDLIRLYDKKSGKASIADYRWLDN